MTLHRATTLRRTPPAWDRHWREHAACTTDDLELFFAQNHSPRQGKALRMCQTCPVQTECLAHALDTRIPEGVYGGTTGSWRRSLLARRPEITSWQQLLGTARDRHRSSLSATE
ncbi:WhiB family transcriptional regulator [Streptomyces sp. NBRC 110611]|uniref:WhiB family transcriptional regulator n=1 Tax=Streptomyces sp. NBRC 110611 TaxID=1621259 RepID=UPI0009A07DC3|nr:WhiB family transcriptional regulator [Streptomyces sp. NBRC 110611]